MLSLFYSEPDTDRWVPFDRYPRRVVSRIIRGKPRIGGHTRVFLNLCAGLDLLNMPYRVNDYRYVKKHPDEIACIIGKPHILNKIKWVNPIVFGAAVYSHPIDDPLLLRRLPVRKVLVPCEWMRKMCEPVWDDKVVVWPVGIDTETWAPVPEAVKDIDIIVYDKVRWEYERYERELIRPIVDSLNAEGLKFAVLRYGYYREEDFSALLKRSRALLFLCEHETQGIAYQQALSCGVPILAWDRGGFWQDPSYYPDKVKFGTVSSVPYWDGRCGLKFENLSEYPDKLKKFLGKLHNGSFAPRDYILENLTLQKCAQQYVDIVDEVRKDIQPHA